VRSGDRRIWRRSAAGSESIDAARHSLSFASGSFLAVSRATEKLRQTRAPALQPVAVLQPEKRILPVIFGSAPVNECKCGRCIVDNDRLNFGATRESRLAEIGHLPREAAVAREIEAMTRAEQKSRARILLQTPYTSNIVTLQKGELHDFPLGRSTNSNEPVNPVRLRRPMSLHDLGPLQTNQLGLAGRRLGRKQSGLQVVIHTVFPTERLQCFLKGGDVAVAGEILQDLGGLWIQAARQLAPRGIAIGSPIIGSLNLLPELSIIPALCQNAVSNPDLVGGALRKDRELCTPELLPRRTPLEAIA